MPTTEEQKSNLVTQAQRTPEERKRIARMGAEAANKKTRKGLFKYASKIKKGTVIKRGTVLFLLKSAPQVVIKGKGNFKGTLAPVTFTISRKDIGSLTGMRTAYEKRGLICEASTGKE